MSEEIPTPHIARPAVCGPGADVEDVDRVALRHHGDVEVRAGMVDFAVNVQGSGPPEWLRERVGGR
ncbi:hypothetical protein AWN90_35560 [Nocardia terpenica]|uniref:Uncharacterized protein n=1 Tax=Nocardia terpenica TaxID=455432 RepID=A0A161XJ95_9NOCA|nr:hypothetical protein AWN90_35560 [Nocardia terpenica]